MTDANLEVVSVFLAPPPDAGRTAGRRGARRCLWSGGRGVEWN